MNLRNLIVALMLLAGIRGATLSVVAQTTNAQIYTLITGSQLTDDCPMCGRPPIVVPLKGTFGLRLLHENPLYMSYELLGISFHAGAGAGLEYQVIGSGTYRIGGEVAVLQDMFLEIEIDNGYITTKAQCVNTNRVGSQHWPKIQINVDQTNGTPGQVYYLTLVAVPVPKLRSFAPDPHTGDVHLEWDGNGGSFQVERAPSIGGPYSALTPSSTNSSFTDPGALTNLPKAFYRLRQF